MTAEEFAQWIQDEFQSNYEDLLCKKPKGDANYLWAESEAWLLTARALHGRFREWLRLAEMDVSRRVAEAIVSDVSLSYLDGVEDFKQALESQFLVSERSSAQEKTSVASEDESRKSIEITSEVESTASVHLIPFVAIGNDEISEETKMRVDKLFGSGDNDDGLKAISLLLTGEETLPKHCDKHNKDFFLNSKDSFPCCKDSVSVLSKGVGGREDGKEEES